MNKENECKCSFGKGGCDSCGSIEGKMYFNGDPWSKEGCDRFCFECYELDGIDTYKIKFFLKFAKKRDRMLTKGGSCGS
jgi:hypothetical protein